MRHLTPYEQSELRRMVIEQLAKQGAALRQHFTGSDVGFILFEGIIRGSPRPDDISTLRTLLVNYCNDNGIA